MKNLLLFFIAFLITKNAVAQNIKQTDWQWRNSNSTETTPSIKASINIPVTGIATNSNLRIRLKIEEIDINTGSGTAITVRDELFYTTKPDDNLTWVSIGNTDNGSVPFIIQSNNTSVVQYDETSNQLGGVTSNFYKGIYMVTNTLTDAVNFTASSFTEIEWCLKVCANAQPGTKYYFKEYGSTNNCNSVGVGAGLPSLTTIGVLPIKLTSFNLQNFAKKISLTWITASEDNNDRFEILRSSNSKDWKTVITVKGKGTTDLSNNYNVLDEHPLNGINYYIIKQYNTNGSFSLSEIKALKLMADTKSFVSVSPNPTHGCISFSTTQSFNNVEVSLANLNGGNIHKEIIAALTPGSINKLKLLKLPAPGLYILTLKGNGMYETNKVIIY